MEDEVEAAIGVSDEPAAAVIDDDVDFRIGEQTGDTGALADEGSVARIDFDDGDVLDGRIVGDDLGPGAGRESDDEQVARIGMEGGDSVGAKDAVVVVDRIEIEVAVVDAAAVDGLA